MLPKKIAKDRVLATVVSYTREGWPLEKVREENNGTGDTAYTVEAFRKIRDSLSVSNGCLFYGARVVIPASLFFFVFGMQKVLRIESR